MNKKLFKNRIFWYWCALLVWFSLSFLLNIRASDEVAILYLAFHIISLIILFMYEGNVVITYLKVHYPNEAKRLSSTFYWDKEKRGFPFLLSFSPDDAGWKFIQAKFKNFLFFGAISIFAWVGFGVLRLFTGSRH